MVRWAENIFRHLGRQLHDQRDARQRPPTGRTLRLQVRAKTKVGPRPRRPETASKIKKRPPTAMILGGEFHNECHARERPPPSGRFGLQVGTEDESRSPELRLVHRAHVHVPEVGLLRREASDREDGHAEEHLLGLASVDRRRARVPARALHVEAAHVGSVSAD